MRRNPFARTEVKRTCLANRARRLPCDWCGQQPDRLYKYGTESDGGRFYGWNKGQFCNIGCHDAYHS